jgi:tetratricopeptide (TPR) repeat protein
MIPPQIMIGYNPQAPGARLASARSLTLVVAGKRGSRFVVTNVPMTRTRNGAWQAVFTPGGDRMPFPGYWIFFFEDEAKQADNNRAQYWDFPMCGSDVARIEQAATYEGRVLAPGFERAPDLARAIDLLKTNIQHFPDSYMSYGPLWRFELELANESPAAYEQVGREVDELLIAHGDYSYALLEVVSFVASHQRKLPPPVVQRFRDAVTALPRAQEFIMHDGAGKTYRVARDAMSLSQIQGFQRESTLVLAEFDYWAIDSERSDLRKKAADYLAFAARYPDPESAHTGGAYASAFECYKQLNDLGAAEAVFEKWASFDPASPLPPLAMAEYYVARKAKPERALKLLDAAASLYLESNAPSSHLHFREEPGRLESLRDQARLILKDSPAAGADHQVVGPR